MPTLDILLGVPLLVASGTVAGVLFAVALSVVPAFLDLPPDRYIEVHKLIGRRFDHVMPPLVVASAVLDVVLAATTASTTCRGLFVSAAVLGSGVAAVSQFGNVPLNRRVKSIPAGCVPTDWDDPRARWRALHLVRTSLAVLALVANSGALLLAR
jgi:uncharacterized membrane protein